MEKGPEYYSGQNDIYFEYEAAKELQKGGNPYNRILEGNMIENDKYATQLPLYFYTLSYIRQMSGNGFEEFLENFRVIVFWSHVVGGVMIYLLFREANKKLYGYCASLFFLFNVWSLNSFLNLKQDLPAIALLLLSYFFFRKSKFRWLSYILYGLSLGIKHIGVFIAPMYLMPLIHKQDSYKKFGINVLLLFLTIFIPSASLFFDNPASFINSMLFSLTRTPLDSEITFGYNKLLTTYNPSFNTGTLYQQLLPRLPLLISSLLCFLLLVLKRIPISMYLFLSVLVFATFNPIIFPQYFTWVTPLASICILDYVQADIRRVKKP
jgi:hypothetical protein